MPQYSAMATIKALNGIKYVDCTLFAAAVISCTVIMHRKAVSFRQIINWLPISGSAEEKILGRMIR
jgi:hypothetical protein